MHIVLRQLHGWTAVLVGALVIIGVISLGRAIRELRESEMRALPQSVRRRRIALASATSVGAFSAALTYVTVGIPNDIASYVLWAMVLAIFIVNMATWRLSK